MKQINLAGPRDKHGKRPRILVQRPFGRQLTQIGSSSSDMRRN